MVSCRSRVVELGRKMEECEKAQVLKPINIVANVYGCLSPFNYIDKLKAFAEENVKTYLKDHWGDPRIMIELDTLRKEAKELVDKAEIPEILEATNPDTNAVQKSLAANIKWRLQNRSSDVINLLTDEICEDGYKNGALKSHIFQDVPKALEDWTLKHHIELYTLFSGKKDGQRLFFKFTQLGDLTPHITDFIDTSEFDRRSKEFLESVLKVLIEMDPKNVLFLTESPKEAKAAIGYGMSAVVTIRPGNQDISPAEITSVPYVQRLTDIKFEEIPAAIDDNSSTGSIASEKSYHLCPRVLSNKGYSIQNKVIGSGAFSKVYRARYTLLGDKDIAAKVIQLDKVSDEWKKNDLKNELKIFKNLDHPHIIKGHGVFKTEHRAFIFMDLAENSSIMTFMQKKERACTEREAKKWFKMITGAIAYLHENNIAHRDLKNENFLLDRQMNAKLTDFGFACFTTIKSTRDPTYSVAPYGTPGYIAPELNFSPYDAKQKDIWSLGVCLFEMLSFTKPFKANSSEELLDLQQRRWWRFPALIEARLSNLVKDLAHMLLDPDFHKRPHAKDILLNGWLTGK